MTSRLELGLVLGSLLASGCGSVQVHKADGFDPRVPLRVAVLPFVDISSGDPWYSVPLTKMIDLVPILSDDRLTKENSALIFREKFQGSLYRTHLDIVNLHVIDSVLADRKIASKAVYEADRADAAKKLGEALGVDVVVFGWVVEWDRRYYMVQSTTRAGLKVEMRDTVSGGVLFRSEVRDYETSGVAKLPIVYSADGAAQAVIGESLKGLRNTIFITLTDDIARKIVRGLAPEAETRAKSKAPRIHFVAHSARKPLAKGDELIVVALGDKGARATFRIGGRHAHPMTETAPGSYQGRLRVSTHTFAGEPLTVRLVNQDLRGSTMTIARPKVTTIKP